jgi:hypothetical protein
MPARIREFVVALRLREGWHLAGTAAPFVVGLAAKFGFGWPVSTSVALTCVLFAAFTVTFAFSAWLTERKKNEREWPRLNEKQRNDLVGGIEPIGPLPEIKVWHSAFADCAQFAADLSDVILHSTAAAFILSPTTPRNIPNILGYHDQHSAE